MKENNFDASVVANPNIAKPNAVELLGGLYERDPKLFWFLEGKDPNIIQNQSEGYNGLTYGRVNNLPVVVDVVSGTLASDPINKPNEDSYANIDIGPGRTLFALIDGASSQAPISGLEKHGVSGAFYVSHLIAYGFKSSESYKELCSRTDIKAKDIMVSVNDWVRGEMQKVEGVDYNNVLTIPGAAATFVLLDISNEQMSIAHVADTIEIDNIDGYLANDIDAVNIHTGNRNAAFDDVTLALANQISQEKGITIVEASKDPRVRQQLKDSYKSKINTPNGVGILNGMPQLVENDLIEEKTVYLRPLARKYQDDNNNLIADSVGNLPVKEQVIRVGIACDGYWTAFPEGDSVDPKRILYSMESLEGQEIVHDFFTKSDTQQEIVPRLKPVDDITSTFIRIKLNGSLDIESNFKVVPEVEGPIEKYPAYLRDLVPLPVGNVSQFDSSRRFKKEFNEQYTEVGGATTSPI
jgi:hypothetical protein